MQCSRCLTHNVTNLNVEYLRGVSFTQGFIDDNYTQLVGESGLAGVVTPPGSTKTRFQVIWFLAWIAANIIYAANAISIDGKVIGTMGVVFGCVFFLTLLLRDDEYHRKLDIWDSLGYCSGCAVVTNPANNKHYSVLNMESAYRD